MRDGSKLTMHPMKLFRRSSWIVTAALCLSNLNNAHAQEVFNWQGASVSISGGGQSRSISLLTDGNPFWNYAPIPNFGQSSFIGLRAPNVPIYARNTEDKFSVGGMIGATTQFKSLTFGVDLSSQFFFQTSDPARRNLSGNTLLAKMAPKFEFLPRFRLGYAIDRFHLYGFAGMSITQNAVGFGFYRDAPTDRSRYLGLVEQTKWAKALTLGVGVQWAFLERHIVGIEASRKFDTAKTLLSNYPVGANPNGNFLNGVYFPPRTEDFWAKFKSRDYRVRFTLGFIL
jgi:opacity protein-like surface antigen